MSIEEIKSEIENLTSKSLSEVIDFAIHVRKQREISTAASLEQQKDDGAPEEKNATKKGD